MATEKQIRANRANAKKSTGPRTSAGKEKSARNGFRHGAFARAVVLDFESRARFIELLSSLQDELQPRNSIESWLVESMAVARWHQMRIWAMETASISSEMKKQDLDNPDIAAMDPCTRAATAFRTLADNSRCLDAIGRKETRYYNQYDHALDRLMKLREKK
jgi:hypothetical protein